MKFKASGLLSIAALALGFSGGVAAQSTWNFGSGVGTCDVSTCNVGGTIATISGYGSTNSGSAYAAGTVTNQGSSGLGFTSALSTGGSESTTSPDHAFDNRAGGTSNAYGTATNEMLLINFGAAKVALSAIALGWTNTDSDVSVLRWDGASNPNLTTTNGSAALASAGWTLISSKDVDGNAGNIDTAGGSFTLNTGTGTNKNDTKVSSWWLISSYFGAASGNLDTSNNDFFKILSFTGAVCTGTVTGGNGGTCGHQTPEPGSFALMGIALVGAAAARRRKRG